MIRNTNPSGKYATCHFYKRAANFVMANSNCIFYFAQAIIGFVSLFRKLDDGGSGAAQVHPRFVSHRLLEGTLFQFV